MKIAKIGPVVRSGDTDILIIVVERDDGSRVRLRMYNDVARRLMAEGGLEAFTKAVRASVEGRSLPDPEFRAAKGAEI